MQEIPEMLRRWPGVLSPAGLAARPPEDGWFWRGGARTAGLSFAQRVPCWGRASVRGAAPPETRSACLPACLQLSDGLVSVFFLLQMGRRKFKRNLTSTWMHQRQNGLRWPFSPSSENSRRKRLGRSPRGRAPS